MTTGRPKSPTAEVIEVRLNEDAIKAGTNALNVVATAQRETAAAVIEMARRMEYQGSLNPDDLEAGLKADKEELGNLMFRTGARYLLLKQQCPHGEFLQRIERAGCHPREAQRCMQAVLKFMGSNATPESHLNEKKIQALSKKKVVELSLTLKDEEVAELKDIGSVRGITLDEMDCMSASELRAKLKQAEEAVKSAKAEAAANLQAKDQLLASVRERANQAEEKLSRFETQGIPLDERFSKLSTDVLNLGKRADDALIEVANLFRAVEMVLTEAFEQEPPQQLDRDGAIALAQRVRDQGFRLARTVGRIQAVVDDSIYPLISMDEMHLPYTPEDDRPIEG